MSRPLLLAALVAGLCVHGAASAPLAGPPGEAACLQHVIAVQKQAEALPDGDLTRRFAETDLAQAMQELGAGDPEECIELAERAEQTLEARPYVLRPGEVAHGGGPDSPSPAPFPAPR